MNIPNNKLTMLSYIHTLHTQLHVWHRHRHHRLNHCPDNLQVLHVRPVAHQRLPRGRHRVGLLRRLRRGQRLRSIHHGPPVAALDAAAGRERQHRRRRHPDRRHQPGHDDCRPRPVGLFDGHHVPDGARVSGRAEPAREPRLLGRAQGPDEYAGVVCWWLGGICWLVCGWAAAVACSVGDSDPSCGVAGFGDDIPAIFSSLV